MPQFPSEQWVRDWVTLADESEEFRISGGGWSGAVDLVVEGSADGPVHILLDGADGRWSRWAVGPDPTPDVRIRLTASEDVWRQVIRQELSPLVGILQGRIRVRGHLPDIMRYRSSITIMCELAGKVSTEFGDG